MLSSLFSPSHHAIFHYKSSDSPLSMGTTHHLVTHSHHSSSSFPISVVLILYSREADVLQYSSIWTKRGLIFLFTFMIKKRFTVNKSLEIDKRAFMIIYLWRNFDGRGVFLLWNLKKRKSWSSVDLKKKTFEAPFILSKSCIKSPPLTDFVIGCICLAD